MIGSLPLGVKSANPGQAPPRKNRANVRFTFT